MQPPPMAAVFRSRKGALPEGSLLSRLGRACAWAAGVLGWLLRPAAWQQDGRAHSIAGRVLGSLLSLLGTELVLPPVAGGVGSTPTLTALLLTCAHGCGGGKGLSLHCSRHGCSWKSVYRAMVGCHPGGLWSQLAAWFCAQ